MQASGLQILAEGFVFHGRYRIDHCMGVGGMGAVYEVHDETTAARRVLKVMLPALVDDPAARGRFAQEARVTGGIASDHIVRTLDAGVDHDTGMPFLVMELLHGEELGRMLARRGRMPRGEVVTLLHQAALALGAPAPSVRGSPSPPRSAPGSSRRRRSVRRIATRAPAPASRLPPVPLEELVVAPPPVPFEVAAPQPPSSASRRSRPSRPSRQASARASLPPATRAALRRAGLSAPLEGWRARMGSRSVARPCGSPVPRATKSTRCR